MEKLPFIPNQIYNRRAGIHKLFGGNWQSGICPSREYPFIFIFSGKQGKQHGYKDGWDNPDVFSYTGEGQVGDMKFTSGNLALRDHVKNGKRVFLFESFPKGVVKFITELVLFDTAFDEILDSNFSLRLGIKFFFHRAGVRLSVEYDLFSSAVNSTFPLNHDLEDILPTITERSGLVTSRVGQGAYRKRIIHRWQYKCAVTNFDKPEILIASHIHPWKDASDDERLDVNNGILLSPVYDALFDRHLITFDNFGKIRTSDLIEQQAYLKIGITGNERIKLLNSDNFSYLDKHRKLFELNP